MSFPPPPPPPPPGGHFPTPPALFKYTSQQRQVDHQVSMQQQQQQLQQQPPPPTFNTTSSLPRNIYQQQAPPPAMNGMHHTPPQYYSNPPHVPSASYVQAQNLLPPPHYPPPPPRMMHSAPIMMPTPPPPSFTTIQQPSGNAHALDHPGSTRPYPPPPGPPIFGSHPPAPIDRGLPSPPMQQLQQPPPMQQQKQPPNDHRKIDPSQIPRPPLFTRPQTTSQPIPIYFPRRAMELDEIQVPPPADSRTLCQDDGNASPHLLRSTMYAIPRDRNMANKLGIDFAILCTPLALPSHDFVPRPRIYPDGSYADGDDDGGFDPQRIPLTSMTPSRCRNCHAYANAYWGQDGTCNFCGSKNNDIQPTQYGTVDYQVNGPYVTRENPVGATSIYALDATCPHLRTYVEIITLVGIQMGEHYQRQQGPFMAKPRIGCVLVSSFGVGISYFTDSSGELAYSVMSDVTEDPFCHLPLEQWTYDVSTDEGVEAWKLCMSKVLILWQHSLKEIAQGAKGYASSCGGAALAFMADALKDCGGRATWISWRRPNFGVGLIRDRELNNLQFYTNESSERPLYCPLQLQRKLQSPEQTTADFYKKLGQDCSRNRICVDIIMHTLPKPMAFLDFGTLGELCRKSSGTLKWIRAPDWKEQFREELCRPILSFVGTDVIFKVRSSEGIEVKSYLSSTAPGTTVDGGIVGSPELELSAVLPNTCIAVELEHRVGGINKKQRLVYIQVATLYTAINGRRRVRVSTLALRVSSDPLDIFRCSDFGAYTALLSRQAVNHLWTANDDRLSTLDAARQDLMKKCTHLLAKYRLHAQTSPSPTGQLLLPTKFQLLPLYVMSLMKSAILRSALPPRNSEVRANRASPNADDRAYALFHAASVTPACAMLLVHPNIFPLTNLFDGAGDWQIPLISNARSDLEQAAHHAFVQLPNSIHPSIASMEDENIYLIDDGINLFIFVGHDAPKDIKAEIIESDSDKGCRVSTSSDVGLKVYRLLWQMRTHVSVGGGSESSLRPSYPPCIVVLQHPSHKDPFDDMVMKLMVDDTISGCGNYTNFLVDMHHRVRTEVENGTTRNF